MKTTTTTLFSDGRNAAGCLCPNLLTINLYQRCLKSGAVCERQQFNERLLLPTIWSQLVAAIAAAASSRDQQHRLMGHAPLNVPRDYDYSDVKTLPSDIIYGYLFIYYEKIVHIVQK